MLTNMTPAEIVKLRKALGKTQAEFGELLGSEQATVSRWESGQWEPNAHQVKLMQGFKEAAEQHEGLKELLAGAGLIAALALLFTIASKKGQPK
jgi:transcriptional regulator with XRE-family HTH domain